LGLDLARLYQLSAQLPPKFGIKGSGGLKMIGVQVFISSEQVALPMDISWKVSTTFFLQILPCNPKD